MKALILSLLTLSLITPDLVLAANFTVSPLFIEAEAVARESFVKEIKLTSAHHTHMRLFASVHEITLGDDSEIKEFVPASMSDRSTAVTSWIEIDRGRIDLQPGESTTLPLTVRVNHDTPAGEYHAFVGFVQASNRDEAEAKILAGEGTGVVVRIAVGGKQEEFLKLVSFSTDNFSIRDGQGIISYVLENTGDVPLTPTGDIIIYDGRGRELTSIEVNNQTEPVVIAPGEKKEFTDSLPYLERLGRHKAYLSVEFGQENKAALYDTAFYYSIPWYYLMLIVVLLFIVLVSLVMLARRGGNNYEEPDAHDVPVMIGRVREHNQYDHDINLKKNNTESSS